MEHRLTGRFASFQIQQFLASGNIADIYLARDDSGQAVVLKSLRSANTFDTAYTRRLFLEGEILSSIQTAHPYPLIPRCLEMGRESKTGNPFLALTYLEGLTLRSLMASGRRFSLSDIVGVGKGVCLALEAVHESGFCHHAVDADNILVQTAQANLSGVALVGFGTACLENTQGEVTAGKLLTMSPEECRNEPITRSSDLYSLGVLLYEMAVGQPPFSSRTDNPAEIMEWHRSAEPNVPSGVEEPLHTILLALLSKDPSQRPPGAARLTAMPAMAAGMPAIYPLASEEAVANRFGRDLSSTVNLDKLLGPSEVYLSEPEKLMKEPLEERLGFPLHLIPDIPDLGDVGLRTPSQDPLRKEPSDDDFQVREVFPSETLLREHARDDVPLDELGLPSIEQSLAKEPFFLEPSDRDRDSEKRSVRPEIGKEELSSLQEAMVGPGAIQDLDQQSKSVIPPVDPVTSPTDPKRQKSLANLNSADPAITPPAKKSRRGAIALMLSGCGVFGILLASLSFMFLHHSGSGPIPPITKVPVSICTVSGQVANEYCPPATVKTEEFVKGQEPKEVCTVHHKPVPPPPPQTVKVRVCTVSGKLPNPYCPKGTVKLEEYTKGQEPTEVCKVHHKPVPPPPQWVTVRICSVSGRLPNRYCPADVITIRKYLKGKQPTEHCTVHHKPKPVLVPIAKKCPVGGEIYPLSAIYCNNAAHKQNGKYPRLTIVKGPKR